MADVYIFKKRRGEHFHSSYWLGPMAERGLADLAGDLTLCIRAGLTTDRLHGIAKTTVLIIVLAIDGLGFCTYPHD